MRSKGKGQQCLLGEFKLKLHPKNERKLLAKIGKFKTDQSSNKCGKQQRLFRCFLRLRKKDGPETNLFNVICPLAKAHNQQTSYISQSFHFFLKSVLQKYPPNRHCCGISVNLQKKCLPDLKFAKTAAIGGGVKKLKLN